MSTHAIISIEGKTHFYLYKHFDGYPESTLPWLKEFNKKFKQPGKIFSEFKAAQLVRSTISYCAKYILDKDDTNGWAIYTTKECPDVAHWRYRLMNDGTVKVINVVEQKTINEGISFLESL